MILLQKSLDPPIMQKSFLLSFALLAGLFMASCDSKYLYNEEHPLPKTGWTYSDTLDFSFEIPDTTQLYNLLLEVQHSPEYAYQNIYTQIYTRFPSGQRLHKLLSLELTDKDGIWAGDCSRRHCNIEIPIQTEAYFNEPGKYVITLEQFMRRDTLVGVQRIGLKVEKTGKQR